MTKRKIFVCILILALAVIIYFISVKSHKHENIPPSPSPVASISPSPIPSPSSINPAVRAAVRVSFIKNCQSKGKASQGYCSCAADYLSKKYSDQELEKMYVDYHTSNKLPSDVMSAVDQECNNK